jgi:nucleotide-binding universal stress UspA family protein
MFRRILVPIDGSPNSYRGLQHATDIAKKFNAEIALIHVIETPQVVLEGEVPLPESYYTRMEAKARALFAKRKAELRSRGLDVKTMLVKGDPIQEILKASKNFDLVVMGSKGYGTFRRFWLGSVANGVVNHCTVPVLIVRPE